MRVAILKPRAFVGGKIRIYLVYHRREERAGSGGGVKDLYFVRFLRNKCFLFTVLAG